MTEYKFEVGEEFSSFKELKNKIDHYKQEFSTELVILTSRTLGNAFKRKTLSKDRNVNESLKYYEIQYVCKHSGKARLRSTGKRKTSSYRNECPFFINIGLSKDVQSLVVTKAHFIHNHEINRNLFRHYASQRKLDKGTKYQAIDFLKAGANKKKVRQKLASETGKIVTMRDIHNLNQLSKTEDPSRNDLQRVVDILRDEFGCSVSVRHDKKDNFLGLFFQDESMKENFDRFPEILFLDATFKVNEVRIPAYIFLVEDSLGQSEVVGVALLINETKENLTWLINKFADENPTKKIRVVMADKDVNERNRIAEILGVPILICLFHALKAFKRELSTLSLTKTVKEDAKTLFEKMCYAWSQEEFEKFEKQFEALESPDLVAYYKTNWKPISKEWVRCFKAESGDFLNSTNNRLESFNSKLKTVVNIHCSLEEFVRGFFTVLSALRTERDVNVVKEFQKTKFSIAKDPNIVAIRDHLTSYSADFVCNELAAFPKTSERKSTIDSCDCPFYNSMRLPCRHIFKSRSSKGCTPIFDPDLCEFRWSRAYLHQSQRLFWNRTLKERKRSKFRPRQVARWLS
ncbi:zinc finger SWIM domain-containing protein 3-like [Clytia hemisphaerica]|uniref:zinc finger SWIM domain-containing protein 3-like n=1 Tax=Clytia hemisphaerica TaxID=252671 RepID=UPI0034D79159